MFTRSSSASSRGSPYTVHHLPRGIPSLGCASLQPAGGASLKAGGAAASGGWYFGPIMQAVAMSRMEAVASAIAACDSPSLIAERLDGIQEGRFPRRVVAKEHTDQRGENERRQDRQQADLRGPLCEVRNQQRCRQPDDDPDDAAQQGQGHCFNQELEED